MCDFLFATHFSRSLRPFSYRTTLSFFPSRFISFYPCCSWHHTSRHPFIHGYSLFIIQPLFLFVWVLCIPLLHDWALCSLLFYWELCIPLPLLGTMHPVTVIGNYASRYLLLGTMHPAIYFWYYVTVLFYYILGTNAALCSLLTHYCTTLPVIPIIVCTTFHLGI